MCNDEAKFTGFNGIGYKIVSGGAFGGYFVSCKSCGLDSVVAIEI